jgi:predicted phage terminase large subunit-like protein
MPGVAVLDPIDAVDLFEALERAAAEDPRRWVPMAHQIPPDGAWRVWLLEGGRGSGKTDGAAAYLDQHVNGPACVPGMRGGHRPAIIAPTLGDALEACVNGPSGLKAHNRAITSVQTTGGTYVRWPNGVEGKIFGAYTPEDVERLRAGGNRCIVWAEELAAWVRLGEAWDQMRLGLRLGPSPHVVASSTPKPRKRYLEIRSDARTIRTGASTADNPYLAEDVRAEYFEVYGGTRLGRQELNAEILTDVPGALWTYAMLEDRRPAPDLARVVVAVDPAVTSGEDSDETGIVVAGLGVDGRGYVLGDLSCRLSPDGWAHRAVAALDNHQADLVVAEVNNGGDLVEQTIRTVRRSIPYKKVHASRGKQTRAQPVAALYEQGKVSHVEVLPDLEEQLTTWTPESGTSPDRLDALVWALTELMLGAVKPNYVY